MHFKKPDFFNLKIIFYCRKLIAAKFAYKSKSDEKIELRRVVDFAIFTAYVLRKNGKITF